jgi:hypothetical protein
MAADVEEATALVVMMKLALELPAGIITVAGTSATNGLLLVRAIKAPSMGAAGVRVTVPWDVLPPVTLLGLIVNELTDVGFTVIIALIEASP